LNNLVLFQQQIVKSKLVKLNTLLCDSNQLIIIVGYKLSTSYKSLLPREHDAI